MELKSVFDRSFGKYGQVLEGYDFTELLEVMSKLAVPETGTAYTASVPELEACGVFWQICEEGFGGMPVQLGICCGKNDRMNCLEYHKSSEFNIAGDAVVLMLGLQQDIENGEYDTAKAELFYVPAGTGVELFATTLHYAPCGYEGKPFRVACALPEGTNVGAADLAAQKSPESRRCLNRNKWLLAHPDSDEAKGGAYVGLKGENLVYSCGQ